MTDFGDYLKAPWVSLQKTRNRCKTGSVAKGTPMEGLKALEVTEVRVVHDKIYTEATGAEQPLKSNTYLTLAIEGLPETIAKVVGELRLEETLKGHALKNPKGKGLYELNV